MKNKILILIICFIIIICIISIILYFNKNTDDPESSQNIITGEIQEFSERVKEHNEFSTVENCINKYENYINLNYNEQVDELNYPSLAAMYNISTEEEKKQAILSLLDKNYVEENNISVENIYDYVDESTNQDINFTVLEINRLLNVKNSGNVTIYSVYAEKNGEVNGKYYIVKLDSNNESFCIYETNQSEYNNSQKVAQENNITEIEKNSNNTYIEFTTSEVQIATNYFQQFKQLLLNNPEAAYEELNEQYRDERFVVLDSFIEYVNKNIQELRLMQMYEYTVEESGDYTNYVIKDQYENMYVFTEFAPNDYTVQLDTYTILSDNFKNSYDKASPQGKVMLNADKWVQMLNNRDYTSAYKVLDETFRNNNFGTVDNFENYMRQNYGEHYKVTFGDFSNEGDTYIQPLTLTPISGSNQTKEITIIMRLSDNYGYVMSFVIQ